MTVSCAISTCNNKSIKTKIEDDGILYHTFPRDPELKRKWIERCQNPNNWNPKSGYICSIHFKKDDYIRNLKAELLNLPSRPQLKKGAIPSLNLPPVSSSSENKPKNGQKRNKFDKKDSESDEPKKKLKTENVTYKEELEDDPCGGVEYLDEDYEEVQQNLLNSEELETGVENGLPSYEEAKSKYHALLRETNELELKNKRLQAEFKDLQRKIEADKKKIDDLQKEIDCKTINELNIQKIASLLGEKFSKNQIDLLLKRKKRAKWTKDEISQALTIRQFSKRVYVYLRQKLNFPLPGVSTLQNWATKIALDKGTLHDVLRCMKVAAVEMSEDDRTAVLKFSKIKIKPCTEFDSNNQQVGPHQHILIVQVCGLHSNWKQIIYYNFDKEMTRPLLNFLISKLVKSNYFIIAVVSNCDRKSTSLWNRKRVTQREPLICFDETNGTTHEISVFVDTTNLLEHLYKQFLKDGFVWKQVGKHAVVNKTVIEKLLETTDDLKINRNHLKCTNDSNKNIKKAKELFSSETISALRTLPNDENTKQTIAFFEMVENWYQIFTNNQKPPTKLQIQFLRNFYQEIKTLSSPKNQVQKFILISIKALFDLGTDFLLSKLSLDLFSNLNESMTPLKALNELRKIVLGKGGEFSNNSKKNDSKVELSGESLVSQVLTKSGITVKVPDDTKTVD